MRRLILFNSFSGVFQFVISTILLVLVIPLFIHKLGPELYGIYSLLTLVGNLNVFLSLGINSSLLKYLAEQGKSQESNFDIVVSFIVIFVTLLPFTLIGIFFSNEILTSIFNIPVNNITHDIKSLYVLLLISNSMLFLGQIPLSILDSQQKIYISNFLQMIYNLLYWGLILVSIYYFNSLKSIGFSILAATTLWLVLNFTFAYLEWGVIKLEGLKSNFLRVLKKQISYGMKVYLSGITGFFYEPLTKIFISNFIGIKEVGYFDIALKFRNQLWSLINKIIYPIFPLLAQLNDLQKIKKIIHDVEQKLVYLIVPIIAIIIFILDPLVNLWIGKNVETISKSIKVVVLGYMLGIIVLPNYQFLLAKGYAGKTVIIQMLNVFINTIVFFSFLKIMEYNAVLLANFAAILSSFILTLYYQKLYLKSLIFDNKQQLLKILTVFIVSVFTAWAFDKLLLYDFLKILFVPLAVLLITSILYRILSIFTKNDFEMYFGQGVITDIFVKIFTKKI